MAALDLRASQIYFRLAASQLLLAAAILASVIALPIPYAGSVRPAFLLMIVYYWSIYRPTLMPPWVCFCTGLLLDILSGLPLGVTALILVAAQWVIAGQRRFLMGQNYLVLWAVFALIAGLATLAQWLLYGMLRLHWDLPVMPAASVGLSLLFFPLVTMALIGVHRLLPAGGRP